MKLSKYHHSCGHWAKKLVLLAHLHLKLAVFMMLFFILAFVLLVHSQTFTNPIRNPGPDPHIVMSGGTYYLTNTQASFISITRSTSLGGLANGDTKIVWTDTDFDRNQNIWAPEMHYIDGM